MAASKQPTILSAAEFTDKLMLKTDLRGIGPYLVKDTVSLNNRRFGVIFLGNGRFDCLDLADSVIQALWLDISKFANLNGDISKINKLWGEKAVICRWHINKGKIASLHARDMEVDNFHCGDRSSCIEHIRWDYSKFHRIHTEDNLQLAQQMLEPEKTS